MDSNVFRIPIQIKNLSDSKISDVNVFNYDSDKNPELKYKTGFGSFAIDYKQLIVRKQTVKAKVKEILLSFYSFNPKDVKLFFDANSLILVKKEISGETHEAPLDIRLKPENFQNDRVLIEMPDNIYFDMLDLKLTFIPAESVVSVGIYLEKEDANA